MTESVRNTIEEYGADRLEPGDVIIANDPYRTGTHVNDLLFIRPVFARLGDRRVRDPEGPPARHGRLGARRLLRRRRRTVYENGLVLSPRPLYKAGKPVQETWTLIFDNGRFGDLLFPDMQTICVEPRPRRAAPARRPSSATGPRRSWARCATSATPVPSACSEALAEVPDGVVGGRGDHGLPTASTTTRPTASTCAITKARRPARRSTSRGTSRQARTSINATFLDAKSAVGVAFKYLLDPRGVYTSGLHAADRHRAARGHAHQRDAAGRAGVPVLRGVADRPRGAAACARAGASGERAIGGDAGSLEPAQRGRPAPERHAVAVGRPGGRRAGPVGRHPRGRRRHVQPHLPGERHRDPGRGGRVRRAGRDPAARDHARHRRPGRAPRGQRRS